MCLFVHIDVCCVEGNICLCLCGCVCVFARAVSPAVTGKVLLLFSIFIL